MLAGFRSLAVAGLIAATMLGGHAQAAPAAPEAAPAVIQTFYDGLLDVMKRGKQLGFAGRYQALDPIVHQTFDLAAMIRIAVGSPWASFTPAQQQDLVTAFGRFTVSTYASRFDDFGGEKFQVSPTPRSMEEDVIVDTKLIPSGDEPVVLNYRMRRADAGWHAIDVFLTGTISELATRRSDFGAVVRKGGADALIKQLNQKADAMAGKS